MRRRSTRTEAAEGRSLGGTLTATLTIGTGFRCDHPDADIRQQDHRFAAQLSIANWG